MEQLTDKFDVKEYFEDISIISEPDVDMCVLFLGNKDTRYLGTLSKLCNNLGKKLFVLLENPLREPLPEPHDCLEISLLSESFFPAWLDHLKQQSLLSAQVNSNLICIPRQIATFSPPSAISDELKTVIRYIDDNLHQEVREEDAANLCHYSRNYFSKYFRREMGISFRDYLTSKRLSQAQQLLRDQPKLKIAYIAYQCGYHDVSYFSRIFKKKMGISPATYRHQV
ncbi:helix-turn-helix transcriptional regulator [Vibrio alfacsensis]|uniref:helix-turn-helix transcriptional regulator n=1 Tax=Vibrio alfacsensis TaxID=1074311 RepID=UPI0040691523